MTSVLFALFIAQTGPGRISILPWRPSGQVEFIGCFDNRIAVCMSKYPSPDLTCEILDVDGGSKARFVLAKGDIALGMNPRGKLLVENGKTMSEIDLRKVGFPRRAIPVASDDRLVLRSLVESDFELRTAILPRAKELLDTSGGIHLLTARGRLIALAHHNVALTAYDSTRSPLQSFEVRLLDARRVFAYEGNTSVAYDSRNAIYTLVSILGKRPKVVDAIDPDAGDVGQQVDSYLVSIDLRSWVASPIARFTSRGIGDFAPSRPRMMLLSYSEEAKSVFMLHRGRLLRVKIS